MTSYLRRRVLRESALSLQWIAALTALVVLVASGVMMWLKGRTGTTGRGKSVEERIKRAATQILDDASLTEDMDDVEASQLIDWAVAISRRLAESTAGLDDAQAAEALETHIQNLRRLVRRINKLVGVLGNQPPVEEIDGALDKIVEATSAVPGVALDANALREAIQATQAQSPSDILAQVLSQFKGEMPNGKA